jgi:undecaprenyl-diphosphatase
MEKINKVLIILGILFVIGFFIDTLLLNLIASLRNDVLNKFFIFFDKYINYMLLAIFITLIPFIKKEKRFILLSKLWAGFISAGIISYILKFFIERPRPLISLLEKSMNSFPSGHATVIFTIFIILFYNLKKYKYLWLALAVLTGFSRMYLGVHYFTDVIGGIIIGLLLGININYLFDK